MTHPKPLASIQSRAVVAGAVGFLAIYVAGLIAIILVSTLLQTSAAYDAMMLALRIGGWLALALPAWIAARVANRNAWTYGLLFGLFQGLTVMILMTQSFSWQGTLRAEVMQSMLPTFVLVYASAMLGSAVAHWQNHRLQALHPLEEIDPMASR